MACIRHTVDELGEGEEAADLIRRSYEGVSVFCCLGAGLQLACWMAGDCLVGETGGLGGACPR